MDNLVDKSRGCGDTAKVGVFLCLSTRLLTELTLGGYEGVLVGTVKLACRNFEHNSVVGVAVLPLHYHSAVAEYWNNRRRSHVQAYLTDALVSVWEQDLVFNHVERNTVKNLLTADSFFFKIAHYLPLFVKSCLHFCSF